MHDMARRTFRLSFHLSGCFRAAGFSLALGVTQPAQAERVLDLQFWPVDASVLALGGLWEFHAQKLLEPAQRERGSELLLEFSQPWSAYLPLDGKAGRSLEQGSYVLFLKGFVPRPEGYTLEIDSPESMTRVVVSPKYAPGQSHRVQTEGAFAVFPWLRTLVGPRLKLWFVPRAVDEIWMVIVQRWQADPDVGFSVPRLKWAGHDD
jgi:hypothetical protein